MDESNPEGEEVRENIFRPPLYTQRYLFVTAALEDARWAKHIRKVVDFGCSEMKLIPYLKSLPNVQEIVEVDVDLQTLDANKFRAKPLTFEYLKRRPLPLSIDIFQGSISDYDSSLKGVDAVVCIELIEHLYPDTLEKVPKAIFGCIQPEVAVITTPNADYNIVFKRLEGFRHWDHKFEWTRSEFKDWVDSIVEKYPNYTYELTGVGNPPQEHEDVGYCSQIAIFHRQSSSASTEVPGKFFNLLSHTEYPVADIDHKSEEEKIENEIIYSVNNLSADQMYQSSEEDVAYVPVNIILALVQYRYPSCTEETVRAVAAIKYSLADKDGVQTVRVEVYQSSHEDDEDQESVPYVSVQAPEEEEDWNEDNACESSMEVKIVPACDVNAALPAEPERVAPSIDATWAIEENESNRIAEALQNHGLLLPPPPGYFDDHDDGEEDFHCFHDSDEYDNFDDDFQFTNRGHDCEWMYASGAKTDGASPMQNKKEFPKSMSVEVLHNDGPSSQGGPARIKYGDAMTLCYTGQERRNGPHFPESPIADSCSLDEPDRAADSGYPNSSSLNHEADVDADLTPEQVDDISRSEDGEPSLSDDAQSDASDGEEGVRPARPAARVALPVVFANVENGDLANNNRDGEGNNLAPEDIPGLPLEFAAVVHEGNQLPLLAGAEPLEAPQVDDEGILPEYADPFPPWLSDLLDLGHREGATGRGDDLPDLSDADEGLGEENTLSWSGDAPPRA